MDFPLALLMAGHLVLVNVASGAPLVCMWLEWRSAKGCEAAEKACRMLSRSAFHGLLVGAVLGVVLLVLLWNDAYAAAFKSLSGKIHWGGLEYFFSLALLALHRFLWKTPASSQSKAALRGFVLLLAGTNLLYHFPFLFLILSNTAYGLVEAAETIDSAEFRRLMVADDILPRAVHFIVACFAVTGVLMFLKAREVEDERQREQVIRWGGQLALGPTMLQILVGMWIILRLPSPAARALMGRDMLATACLGLSVLLAFWLMHLFATVALGKSTPKGRVKAAIVLLLVIVLMCVVVQRIKRHGRVSRRPVPVNAEPANDSEIDAGPDFQTDDNTTDDNTTSPDSDGQAATPQEAGS